MTVRPCRSPARSTLADAELHAIFGALWRRARAAWPAFRVDHHAFRRRLARAADTVASAFRLHAADLYLAVACDGDDASTAAAARSRVTEIATPIIDRVARRRLRCPTDVEDLRQELLGLICIPNYRPGRAALIAQYDGRAPLGAWIATVAARRSLNRLTAVRRAPATEPIVVEPVAPPANPAPSDAVLAAARRAIDHTLAAMPAPDSLALRHAVVDGLSLESIGRVVYGGALSVPTISRRLRDARNRFRDALVERLRRGILENRALPDPERDLDFVIGTVLPHVLDLNRVGDES